MVELSGFGTAVGLEPSSRGAEVARARGVGEVVVAGIDTMPFDASRFDLITCLDVLEHIEDDRGALRELRRVARPGGVLLITVPAYPRLWSSHDELNRHCRRYTRPALLSRAVEAGWRPLRTTHFNALLLPVAAASRLGERLRSNSGRADLRAPAHPGRAQLVAGAAAASGGGIAAQRPPDPRRAVAGGGLRSPLVPARAGAEAQRRSRSIVTQEDRMTCRRSRQAGSRPRSGGPCGRRGRAPTRRRPATAPARWGAGDEPNSRWSSARAPGLALTIRLHMYG